MDLTALHISLAALAFLSVAIQGFVELVKRLFAKDYEASTIIAGAAVIGGVAGGFNLFGLDVATGLAAGLAASGAITLAQKVGQGTTV